MKSYFVYILASKPHGVLYVGATNNLEFRMDQHKGGAIEGFTKRYRVRRLVYYEITNDVYAAIRREKAIKKWRRAWKIQLIEKHNPEWEELSGGDGMILPLPKDWDIRPPHALV